MVISREDLRNEAHGWLKQASDDLSSRFLDFMDKNDTQIDELAQVLDIDVDIMQDILDGGLSQVTAEDLIKLFIANDLAVCVMPVANTPIGRFGQATDTRRCTNMRPDGQRFERFSPTRNVFNDANPMRNNGRNQRPTNRPQDPFNGHEPIAVDAQAPQPRDARGRFISRKTVRNDVREDIQRNQMQEHRNPCPYDKLDNEELRQVIRRNLWSSEIDLITATRNDLINFLLHKEEQFAEHRANTVQTNTNSQRHEDVSHNVDDKYAPLIRAMFSAAENDPRLAEQIRKFASHDCL